MYPVKLLWGHMPPPPSTAAKILGDTFPPGPPRTAYGFTDRCGSSASGPNHLNNNGTMKHLQFGLFKFLTNCSRIIGSVKLNKLF